MSGDLAPFNPPLGPRQAAYPFYSPQVTTLEMKEKILSMSGDEFHVRTVEGHDVCVIKGKWMSMHNSKTFTHPSGVDLFTLKRELMSMLGKFVGENPNGVGNQFEVKIHWSWGGAKQSVHFTNAADGQTIELGLKGDWMERKASITIAGRPVAHIQRKWMNKREIFGGRSTYYVTIAPNVDLTLIAAICVCLDEQEKSKSGM